MVQDGAGGDHRHGVLDVGAAEEGGLTLRTAVVAVAPEAAVDAVHDVGPAGYRPDREAPAEGLAVGRQIRGDAEEPLRAARMGAEAGEHLVEHQHDAVPARHLAERPDELDRLQRRVAALDRLDDDRGQIRAHRVDAVDALLGAVVEYDEILDGAARDAGRHRHRLPIGARPH
jgi:hypothetical protein